MVRFSKVIIIILLSLFVASCASIIKYEGRDRGYLAYSQAATADTNYGAYWIHVRSLGGEEALLGYLQNNIIAAEKRDFDDENSNGIVRIESMAPGEYEIFMFAVSRQGEGLPASMRKKVSIPFSVKSNEVTYIGEYLAEDVVGQNMFGLTSSLGVTLKVNGRLSRDIEMLSKNIDIKGLRVTNQMPKVKAVRVD